jgi:hypothetical protein
MSLVEAYMLLSSVTCMYSCRRRLSKCFNSSLEQYNFLHKRIKSYVISVNPYAAHRTKYNSLCRSSTRTIRCGRHKVDEHVLGYRRIVSIASFHEETLVVYMIHKGHYVCKRYEPKVHQKLNSQQQADPLVRPDTS